MCIELNSVALVRERTIPTERPPPVGEVSANFYIYIIQSYTTLYVIKSKLGYNSSYMFRPNCRAIFRLISEEMECTIEQVECTIEQEECKNVQVECKIVQMECTIIQVECTIVQVEYTIVQVECTIEQVECTTV